MSLSLIWKDDPAYPQNAAFYNRMLDIRPGAGDHFVEANSAKTGVVVKADSIIPLKSGAAWKTFLAGADTEVTTLDTGSLTLGTNYYLYICDNGTDSGSLVLSANSTAPSGYTTTNSRKLGGFHYGRVRNSITVSDVTSGSVVPNSVWDLVFRPSCSPEGMVYIGGGVWVDIYLCSVDASITFSGASGSPITGGSVKSAYGATPLSGTEGLSAFNFSELARRTGKRLLTLNEWLQAAHGSPQGNSGDNINAWSATANTGRTTTGAVAYAISFSNVVDCVGNLEEWVNDMIIRWDGAGAFSWRDMMSGMGVGQLYMASTSELVQLACGGIYSHGAYAGARTMYLAQTPWDISGAYNGCRMACNSI